MESLLQRRRELMVMSKGEDWAITAQDNPEVMSVCYAKGLCASADNMSVEECEAVANVQNGTHFRDSAIVHFEEFAYFVKSTGFPAGAGAFAGCTKLERLVFPSTFASTKNAGQIFNCAKKPILVFPRSSMVTLLNDGARDNINSYSSKIYVPDALVNTYKADTRWGVMSSKIYPISEYSWQNLDVKKYLGL